MGWIEARINDLFEEKQKSQNQITVQLLAKINNLISDYKAQVLYYLDYNNLYGTNYDKIIGQLGVNLGIKYSKSNGERFQNSDISLSFGYQRYNIQQQNIEKQMFQDGYRMIAEIRRLILGEAGETKYRVGYIINGKYEYYELNTLDEELNNFTEINSLLSEVQVSLSNYNTSVLSTGQSTKQDDKLNEIMEYLSTLKFFRKNHDEYWNSLRGGGNQANKGRLFEIANFLYVKGYGIDELKKGGIRYIKAQLKKYNYQIADSKPFWLGGDEGQWSLKFIGNSTSGGNPITYEKILRGLNQIQSVIIGRGFDFQKLNKNSASNVETWVNGLGITAKLTNESIEAIQKFLSS